MEISPTIISSIIIVILLVFVVYFLWKNKRTTKLIKTKLDEEIFKDELFIKENTEVYQRKQSEIKKEEKLSADRQSRDQINALYSHPVFSIIKFLMNVRVFSLANVIPDGIKTQFFLEFLNIRLSIIEKVLFDFIDNNKMILNSNTKEFNDKLMQMIKLIQEETFKELKKKAFYEKYSFIIMDRIQNANEITSYAIDIIVTSNTFQNNFERINFLYNIYIIIVRMSVDNIFTYIVSKEHTEEQEKEEKYKKPKKSTMNDLLDQAKRLSKIEPHEDSTS